MYSRLLLESLRRGTRRKLLAVSAVALGTLGATALAEVMLASGDRMAAEMSSYGANLELVPVRGSETLAVADLARIRKIFWRNNIVAFAPLYPLRARLAPEGHPVGAPDSAVVASLTGTWFDHEIEPRWRTGLLRVRPTLRIEGRWPQDERAEVVLGRRLAERLGSGIGSGIAARLSHAEEVFQVVGIVASGGEEDEQAFAPLNRVQRLAGHPGRFTRAEIFALTNPESRNVRDPRQMSPEEYEAWYCTAYPSSVAFQID